MQVGQTRSSVLCGMRLVAEFEEYCIEPKRGIYFASVPNHYRGKNGFVSSLLRLPLRSSRIKSVERRSCE
jgi:hypothetical protein